MIRNLYNVSIFSKNYRKSMNLIYLNSTGIYQKESSLFSIRTYKKYKMKTMFLVLNRKICFLESCFIRENIIFLFIKRTLHV